MISSDSQVFTTDTSGSEVEETSTAPRARVDRIALGAVALLVVVAIAMAWPRSSRPPAESPPPPATATSTDGPPPTTVPGRDAPVPAAGLAFELNVEPTAVLLGMRVVMQLEGDLRGVSSPIAAVVWVDEQVSGVWRTVSWMARSPGNAQSGGSVTNDLSEPSPDALTFAADQPVRFDVDSLPSGTYRLCRYVPLRTGGTSSLPSSNPAYVCAPLIVDHVKGPVATADEDR